ncbi:hypothetical protein RRG08_066209 [Elysia crispata]|uniref:SMB domain-containing protein n=1 Tax=Elysia crispata TaxID=231223 RepID=A0AAE1BD74_9GAST|nr:hypothetical protein RRG08_066209 [Elysia crispata]
MGVVEREGKLTEKGRGGEGEGGGRERRQADRERKGGEGEGGGRERRQADRERKGEGRAKGVVEREGKLTEKGRGGEGEGGGRKHQPSVAMYRLLGPVFQAWCWLVIRHVTAESIEDLDNVNITISTLEDLRSITKVSGPRNAIMNLCLTGDHRCQFHCGRKPGDLVDFNRGFIPFNKPEVCFCDVNCLAYGDCCWDFAQSCQHLVSKFNQSPLRHARAQCVGAYNFLAFGRHADNGTGSSPVDLAKSRSISTIGDVPRFLIDGNVVSDIESGVQYMTPHEFALFYPELAAEAAEKRLTRWTPQLMFATHRNLQDIVKLVQNSSSLFTDAMQLAFEPSRTDFSPRKCPLQSLLICQSVAKPILIRLVNISFVCQSLPDALDLTLQTRGGNDLPNLRNRDSGLVGGTLQHHDSTTNVSTTPNLIEDAIASTAVLHTLALSNMKMESCKNEFFGKHSSYKGFIFGTIIDLKSLNRLKLKAQDGSSSWKSVACSQDTEFESTEESGQPSCDIDVTCRKGLLYANGACASPNLMMLRVKAATNESYSHTTLTPALNYMDHQLTEFSTSPILWSFKIRPLAWSAETSATRVK